MAAGEYVSVSSQSDTEHADLAVERRELDTDSKGEEAELAAIYVARGLDAALAAQVAKQLMAKDALAAHARDELGFSDATRARPLQAALASAVSFACGALVPVLLSAVIPPGYTTRVVTASSIVLLAMLGAIAARVGGAPMIRGAMRVVLWGSLAMAMSMLVGRFFGAAL